MLFHLLIIRIHTRVKSVWSVLQKALMDPRMSSPHILFQGTNNIIIQQWKCDFSTEAEKEQLIPLQRSNAGQRQEWVDVLLQCVTDCDYSSCDDLQSY